MIILLLLPLKSAIFDRGLVIGDFTVPDELQKNGVTSAVVGRLLFDRISEMQRVATNTTGFEETRLGATAFAAGEKAANLVDVKLPGADISLVSLVSQLRTLLHIKDTKIVGEILISHKAHEPEYQLRAHSTGGILWVEDFKGADVLTLADKMAVTLVERFDPLIAGFYHLGVPQPEGKNIDHAINIAEGFHSDEENRQSWALMLRGLAYSEKNDPSNAQASLCAAIDKDPSFMPAWRVLAGMLRGQGDGTKAYDLALRLVHSRPEEPEGYRQLGNLRQDCMAGEEQAEQAKRFFEKAIEIGAQRGSGHTDYLSHLDYAKFLYSWYDPGKKNESSSRRGAASSKRDYLEAATDQLKQAQKIAPNEASVSALLATIVGYPRLDETREERELRLLVAELEANFALSEDSGDPFLSTAMGELLTDHGVEAHKYHSTEKFTKAKELFTGARRSAAQSEGLYEALHARALAGTGDFAAADNVLRPLEQRSTMARKRPYYHLEWVRGEMLYNQGRLPEALFRLKRAESIRTCGPRSNLVHELIGVIERELTKGQIARRAEPPTTSAQLPRLDWQYAWWRREGKSVSDPQPACPGWKALAGDEAVPPRVESGLWQRIFGRWAN